MPLAFQTQTLSRATKNERFADDGSFESVALLLKKLALKCYHRRVIPLGLGMTLEDVEQEMNLSYVRAVRSWNPKGGSRFSTYLTTACLNNFNDRVSRPITERRELGLINFSDMTRHDASAEDDDDVNADRLSGSTMSMSAIVDDEFCGTTNDRETAPAQDSPDYRLQTRQALQDNLARLSQPARVVVLELLRAVNAGETLPRFTEAAASKGISGRELRRLRVEVATILGVKV